MMLADIGQRHRKNKLLDVTQVRMDGHQKYGEQFFVRSLRLAFRLISRQAACSLASGDFHKMWLARLPALLRKNLV